MHKTSGIAGIKGLAILVCALASGAVACQSWKSVEFTTSYGFCAGYCETVVKLDEAASGTIRQSAPRGDLPPIENNLSYPERAAELDNAVERARSISWDARYGCPDCVDQGSYKVTVVTSGATHTTILDPSQHPDAFDPLIAFVARIRSEYPAPAP